MAKNPVNPVNETAKPGDAPPVSTTEVAPNDKKENLSSGGVAPLASGAKIIRVEPRSEIRKLEQVATGNVPGENASFVASAKAVESVVKQIVSIVDSTGGKIIRWQASEILSTEQSDEIISQYVRLSPEAKETLQKSGSRIVARYITSPELLDWLAISGVAIEWTSGIAMAVSEIRKIANETRSMAVPPSPNLQVVNEK